MTEPTETTLSDYFRVLRQRRLMILGIALLCAIAAFVASALQEPRYEATASLTVRDLNQDLTLIGSTSFGTQTQLQIASVHAPQVTRQAVVARVRRTLRSDLTVAALRDRVSVVIDPNSIVVQVTANARTGEGAAAIANAFADADALVTTRDTRAGYASSARKVQQRLNRLPRASRTGVDRNATQRAALQDQLARLRSISTVSVPVEVSDRARTPGSPASPKPVTNTLAALVFGLLLGTAIAYARAALDHRLRTPSEVERALNRVVVGRIRSQALGFPRPTKGSRGKQADGQMAESDAESFRILRHNVRYLAAGEGLHTVLVTSAMAQEGKSTVSSCLAMASAAAGKTTLLIECDLRRPVLAKRFGLAEKPGLSDYLTGQAEPHEILQTIQAVPDDDGMPGDGNDTTLVCITSGSVPPRPADLLGSERFREFLAEVEQVYDTVIIDSAPLLSVADTLEIIPFVSGVLLCVRLDQTTRDQARAAEAALARLPDRPTGLVLTDVKETGEGYYGYYGATPETSKA